MPTGEQEHSESGATTTRREFVKCCARAAALGALPWMVAGCRDSWPTGPEPAGTFDVRLADFPALASANSAVDVRGTPAQTIFVTHTTGDEYFALSKVCTHAGCIVDLPLEIDPMNLPCFCHASRFRLDGTVVDGPAPRPLESWPVTVHEGTLTIHFG